MARDCGRWGARVRQCYRAVLGLDVVNLLVLAFAQTLEGAAVVTFPMTTPGRFVLLPSLTREWCEGHALVSHSTRLGVGRWSQHHQIDSWNGVSGTGKRNETLEGARLCQNGDGWRKDEEIPLCCSRALSRAVICCVLGWAGGGSGGEERSERGGRGRGVGEEKGTFDVCEERGSRNTVERKSCCNAKGDGRWMS